MIGGSGFVDSHLVDAYGLLCLAGMGLKGGKFRSFDGHLFWMMPLVGAKVKVTRECSLFPRSKALYRVFMRFWLWMRAVSSCEVSCIG